MPSVAENLRFYAAATSDRDRRAAKLPAQARRASLRQTQAPAQRRGYDAALHLALHGGGGTALPVHRHHRPRTHPVRGRGRWAAGQRRRPVTAGRTRSRAGPVPAPDAGRALPRPLRHRAAPDDPGQPGAALQSLEQILREAGVDLRKRLLSTNTNMPDRRETMARAFLSGAYTIQGIGGHSGCITRQSAVQSAGSRRIDGYERNA